MAFEVGPAFESIFAGNDPLRVAQGKRVNGGVVRCHLAGKPRMKFPRARQGFRILCAVGFEEIPGLMFKMDQTWTRRQSFGWHDELLSLCLASAGSGRK